MNVQELVDKLLSIENKSLEVWVFSEGNLGNIVEEIDVGDNEVLLS